MSKLTKALTELYLNLCEALSANISVTEAVGTNETLLPINQSRQEQEEEGWTPIGALAREEPFYVSVNSIVSFGAFCTLPDRSSALLHWTNLAKKGQGKPEFKEKIMRSLFLGKVLEVRVVEINRKGQVVLNAVNKKKTNNDEDENK